MRDLLFLVFLPFFVEISQIVSKFGGAVAFHEREAVV